MNPTSSGCIDRSVPALTEHVPPRRGSRPEGPGNGRRNGGRTLTRRMTATGSGPGGWRLHLYRYAAELTVDGVPHAIRPGRVSLVPPGAVVRYRWHYRGRSEHLYAHLRPAGRDRRTAARPRGPGRRRADARALRAAAAGARGGAGRGELQEPSDPAAARRDRPHGRGVHPTPQDGAGPAPAARSGLASRNQGRIGMRRRSRPRREGGAAWIRRPSTPGRASRGARGPGSPTVVGFTR